METSLGEGRGLLPTERNLGLEIAEKNIFMNKYKTFSSNLTVIVLSRQEPEEGRDALAVLGVVEVVAPAVEGPVLVGVVTGRVVLLLVTLGKAAHRHGAHHTGHVDVGQAVGELIHVDVDTVDVVDGVL